MTKQHIYLCIDLKFFYASVECVERGLDPLTTNLVVADSSRTEKTICLAVTPSLKSYHILGRARLFEVVQMVKEINQERKKHTNKFIGESFNNTELKTNNNLKLSYIVASPRMALYIQYSTKIYEIYKRFIAYEDIHVYSIDEVFMDITNYLNIYKMAPEELARKIIQEVYKETNITATAGIGTNLYLAKVAMDIVAKKIEPDENGVRIASLDEMSYRTQLWDHTPLTDFWRIGRGYIKRLEDLNLHTMGDIALYSLDHEEQLYKEFGVNAELLIDHAWGYEPCTIKHIRSYQPKGKSYGSGQVLSRPYTYEETKVIVKEMIDSLSLDLVDKGLLCNKIVLTIGYDIENITNPLYKNKYQGEISVDYLGRKIPKHAHGTENLPKHTSSSKLMTNGIIKLYDRIINKDLLIRRINISLSGLIKDDGIKEEIYEQQSLFNNETNTSLIEENNEKERRAQKAILDLKKKYGKNAVLKGINLEDASTMKDRNNQIGGHKA